MGFGVSRESPRDKLMHLKLLPYSDYAAIARISESHILIKYYGVKGLPDRNIQSITSNIEEIKVGSKDKILYVFGGYSGILVEYHLPEIGCPPAELVSGCS